jgi:TRAP-type C4-dicarboxylate transport system substrate-binding protein
MMKSRSPFCAGLAAFALSALAGLASGAATAATLDVSVFFNESDLFATQYKNWAADVEKRTQGRVQLKAHYSGALTSVVETLNAVRRGVVPAGFTAGSFASGAIPALAYLEAIGGMPNEPETIVKAFGAVQPTLAGLFKKGGVELLWLQPSFDVLVACRDKHLKAPADWTGLKVRAAGRWQSAQVSAMGASPVAINPAEQYLALQNKTVDCVLSVPNLAQSLKLYEVAPKITLLRQNVNLSMYIMNPQSIGRISAEDQAALRKASADAQARAAVELKAAVARSIDALKSAGADVQALSDEELKVARQRMQSAFDRIAEASGEDGKALATALKPYW